MREDLNKKAPRAMAVLRPIKLIIDNYPEDKVEQIEVEVNPENPEMGKRTVEFSRELYIEEDDFMENAPKKYFRLSPGREVRLKSAYYVTCTSCEKDEDGNIIAVHCTYDPETRGGDSPDGRKVKGTIHFVSAAHAIDAEVRLYDRLFTVEKSKLGLEGNDLVDIMDVKCDPEMTSMIIQTYGFLPGYHMNKQHWITILLDGSVSEAKTLDFLDMSYDLIDGADRKEEK